MAHPHMEGSGGLVAQSVTLSMRHVTDSMRDMSDMRTMTCEMYDMSKSRL